MKSNVRIWNAFAVNVPAALSTIVVLIVMRIYRDFFARHAKRLGAIQSRHGWILSDVPSRSMMVSNIQDSWPGIMF